MKSETGDAAQCCAFTFPIFAGRKCHIVTVNRTGDTFMHTVTEVLMKVSFLNVSILRHKSKMS